MNLAFPKRALRQTEYFCSAIVNFQTSSPTKSTPIMALEQEPLSQIKLEEYCPISGALHNLKAIKAFCGKCGQRNPTFVVLDEPSNLENNSTHHFNFHSVPRPHPSAAPRELSVPERSRSAKTPAEMLRQQGMIRRSRAIVTSPNAGAPAYSARTALATSAVIGQGIQELEVDLTVWTCTYKVSVLSSGLRTKTRSDIHVFGSKTFTPGRAIK